MAVLHKKEEKIQAVLGRLPKKYTDEEFVAMFIKLYSKDWGKIKSAYVKQSQDKEPGTVINMPKPDLYLKQVLEIYLRQNAAPVAQLEVPKPVAIPVKTKVAEKLAEAVVEKKPVAKKKTTAEKPAEKVIKPKASTKKIVAAEKPADAIAEKKPTVKKKAVTIEKPAEKVLKPKASTKKVAVVSKAPVKTTKAKALKK